MNSRYLQEKNMQIINLTSHTITETTTGKQFPPSGIVARCKQSTAKVDTIADCPIYTSTFGEVDGLPEPKPGVTYIVSSLTLNAVSSNRTDVVSPGNLQRDENGQPVGCCGFRRK
jgi:hypothetical protein